MSGIRRSGLNVGGILRPGLKPHRSVLEGKAKDEAYYLKRANNILRLYKQVASDFKHYNMSERLSIKSLDRHDQTYMNSAAGPTIIDTLKMIRQTRASLAAMHKFLG